MAMGNSTIYVNISSLDEGIHALPSNSSEYPSSDLWSSSWSGDENRNGIPDEDEGLVNPDILDGPVTDDQISTTGDGSGSELTEFATEISQSITGKERCSEASMQLFLPGYMAGAFTIIILVVIISIVVLMVRRRRQRDQLALKEKPTTHSGLPQSEYSEYTKNQITDSAPYQDLSLKCTSLHCDKPEDPQFEDDLAYEDLHTYTNVKVCRGYKGIGNSYV